MILKLIKLYIVEVTRLLSQKNHSICLCRFKVISIFVKFIGNFLTLLRQSWPLMLGHLTLPTPLNQCCNQTWYAMKFARRVHSNTTLKGGEGEDGNWISKKKNLNYVQVSQLFLSKIVLGKKWNWCLNFKKGSQLPKSSNTNDMIASKYLALTYKHIN